MVALLLSASLLLHPVLACVADRDNPWADRMDSLVQSCERQNQPAWNGERSGANGCAASALRAVATEYEQWAASQVDQAQADPCQVRTYREMF